MHQVVVPVPSVGVAGAFWIMKAEVGGQAPPLTASIWIVVVPFSRSGRSELTGTWRIAHSMSYVPTCGVSAHAGAVNARSIAAARRNFMLITPPRRENVRAMHVPIRKRAPVGT